VSRPLQVLDRNANMMNGGMVHGIDLVMTILIQ
jgi:hypothetical protein